MRHPFRQRVPWDIEKGYNETDEDSFDALTVKMRQVRQMKTTERENLEEGDLLGDA